MMNKESAHSKIRRLNLWLCNTYQAMQIMNSFIQEDNSSCITWFVIPSKDRTKINCVTVEAKDNYAEQVSKRKFWIAVILGILTARKNQRLFIPHKCQDMFSDGISRALFFILIKVIDPRRIRYYDEGLSLIHILSQSKSYGKIADLDINRLKCLKYQKTFYDGLQEEWDIERKVEDCSDPARTASRFNPRTNNQIKPHLHIIASRFLHNQYAFEFASKFSDCTSKQFYYTHPNPAKSSRDIPYNIKTVSPDRALEEHMRENLYEDDIVVIGFTGLAPYIFWLNESAKLRLKIAVILERSNVDENETDYMLKELFKCCIRSNKLTEDCLTMERDGCIYILNGFLHIYPGIAKRMISG